MTIAHTRGGSAVTGSPYTPANLKIFLENTASDVQPGDLFTIAAGTEFTGILNIAVPADHAGTRDSRIKVTGSGFTGYNEIVGITWSAPAAWTGPTTSYAVGDVVENAGTHYACLVGHSSAALFSTDLAASKWVDAGGTIWIGDLTEVGTFNSKLTYVNIDGSQAHSQRWLGANSYVYTPKTETDLEWGIGPNLFAPTKFYLRSDSGAPGAGGPTSIKIAQNYGIFRLTDGCNYWTFEDITATDLGCIAGGNVSTGATKSTLGFTMRRVNTTRCGALTKIGTLSTTNGGQEHAWREWLIEDCHTNISNLGCIETNNVGGGVARGCSGTDSGLSSSSGVFYAGSEAVASLGVGESNDVPDDVYFIDCWAKGTGLYTEFGGIGNLYNQDHNGCHYADGRVKNIHFIGGGAIDQPLQHAMQSNSGGGFVEWVDYTAINCLTLGTVSDVSKGGLGTTAMHNVSGVGIAGTTLSYTKTITGNHIIKNLAGHTSGVNKKGINCSKPEEWGATTPYALKDVVEGAGASGNTYICTTAGTSAGSGGPTGTGTGITDGSVVWDFYHTVSTVTMDNCEFEGSGMTGYGGGDNYAGIIVTNVSSKNNGDTDTTFFESLTSCRIASTSDLAYAGTALWEDTPVLYLTEATDDAWIDHGFTADSGWTIAFTATFDGTNNNADFAQLGSDNNNRHRFYLNTSNLARYIKRYNPGTPTNYITGDSATLIANTEYRFVFRFGAGGSDCWINGTKLGDVSNSDTQAPVIISGTPPAGPIILFGDPEFGNHALDGTMRELLAIEPATELADDECARLSE